MYEAGKPDSSAAAFYDLVNKLSSLYVSFRGRYIEARNNNGHPVVYIPHKQKVEKPLDNAALIAHMKRRVAIGVFAGAKSSKFVCFDVDLHDPDVVRKVMRGLEEVGFAHEDIHVSSSGGKGYHVEIFFDDLMFTDDLRRLYAYVVGGQGLDTGKVEFRPTHGQAIKLPLSKHHKTGNVCWFLDRDTLEPIETVDYLLGIQPVGRDWATQLIRSRCPAPLAQRGDVARRPADIPRIDAGEEFSDLTGPGMRNKTMTAIAIRLRYADVPEEQIREELARWLERQNPDFITDSQRVVERDMDCLAHWVWSSDFKVGGTKEVRLSSAEMRTIIRAAKGYTREILFVLVVLCKRYGRAKISADRCASYVGCTRVTATNALRRLAADGLVTVHHGDVVHVGTAAAGHLVKGANSYDVHLPAVESGRDDGSIVIPNPFKPEDFTAAWSDAAQLLTGDELDQYFSEKRKAA